MFVVEVSIKVRCVSLDNCTVKPTVNIHHTKHLESAQFRQSIITSNSSDNDSNDLFNISLIISNFYRDFDGFFVPLHEPRPIKICA